MRRRRQRLKIQGVEYKGGKCIKCGYDKNIAALDFHHRDPKKKKFRLGTDAITDWKTRKKELDKCDLLCANCHREITY